VMENIILTEICRKCAECCKNYPFVDLSKNEINLLEKVAGVHSSVFTNLKDYEVEGYFLQFQENGHCFFLNEINGNFSCSIYEARPEICKNYPSKPEQQGYCDANSKKFLSKKTGT
jgi:Fe-S-cluster containining protein